MAVETSSPSSGLMENVEFAVLKGLVDSGSLTPGLKYRFPFQTIYRQPFTNTVLAGATEELIVTAETTSSFALVAESVTYTKDVVHYDFNDQLAEDGTTFRPGKIIYRKDTINNNSCYYDFRAVVYRGYTIKLNQFPSWAAATVYNPGQFVKDGAILYRCRLAHTSAGTIAADLSAFKWEDVSDLLELVTWYSSTAFLLGTLPADPATGSNYPTFGANVKNCHIGKHSTIPYNAIFIISGSEFTAGDNCNNMVVQNSAQKNTVSEGTSELIISNGVGNTIGKNCQGNFIGSFSNYNRIGDFCNGIYISGSSSYNQVGAGNYFCYINVVCNYNSTQAACQYIYLYRYSKDSHLGSECSNIVLYNSSRHRIGSLNFDHIMQYALDNAMGESCANIRNTNSTPSYGQMSGNYFGNKCGNISIAGILVKSVFECDNTDITVSPTFSLTDCYFAPGVKNKTIFNAWVGVNFAVSDSTIKTYLTPYTNIVIDMVDSNNDTWYKSINPSSGAITTNKIS